MADKMGIETRLVKAEADLDVIKRLLMAVIVVSLAWVDLRYVRKVI